MMNLIMYFIIILFLYLGIHILTKISRAYYAKKQKKLKKSKNLLDRILSILLILIIFTSIIMIIFILSSPARIQPNFQLTATELLTEVECSPPGLTHTSSGEVIFKKNTIYPLDMFKKAIGGKEIKFVISKKLNSYASENKTALIITKDFQSEVYACTYENKSSYKIGIGVGVNCSDK